MALKEICVQSAVCFRKSGKSIGSIWLISRMVCSTSLLRRIAMRNLSTDRELRDNDSAENFQGAASDNTTRQEISADKILESDKLKHSKYKSQARISEVVEFPFLSFPKIDNHTTELIHSVCAALEDGHWHPEKLEALEGPNMKLSPYLVQQILPRLPSTDVAWAFFQWARRRAGIQPKLVTYVAMLNVFGQAGNVKALIDLLDTMQMDGISSAWPFSVALKWCTQARDLTKALDIWNQMKTLGLTPTVCSYNNLIQLLATEGHHQRALETFRQMLYVGCPPNISTYNALISAFGIAGQMDVASSLFNRLSELGCKPNYSTYSQLIHLYATLGNLEMASKYHHMMQSAGMVPHQELCNLLKGASCRLETSQDSNLNSTSIVEGSFVPSLHSELASSGIRQSNEIDFGPQYVATMLETGGPSSIEAIGKLNLKLTPRFVVQVLQRVKSSQMALIFFDWTKMQGSYIQTEYTYTTMITILGRSRKFEDLDRLLLEMQSLRLRINTQVFTALLTCYGKAQMINGAIQIFDQMRLYGCKPDTVVYTCFIHLLAKHGCHEKALKVFEEMQQVGCKPNAQTYSVVIYNYVKAGKMNEAHSLLERMPSFGCKPNAYTYSPLVHANVKSGNMHMAKQLYLRMREQRIRPLKGTYITLINTMQEAGRVEEASFIHKDMRQGRTWDMTYKGQVEKVARELVFKNVAADIESSQTIRV